MSKKPIRIFSSLFIFVAGVLLLCQSSIGQPSKLFYSIELNDDTINPITSEYIVKSINRAVEDNAQGLIIQLDTPGGLLNSTRSIVKAILASDVPVIVYISPDGSRAGSAGVFITYASHIAAMAPSTNIGAAHPVQMGKKKEDNGGGNFWEELFKTIKPKEERGKEKEETKKKSEPKKEPVAEDSDPMSDKILNDTLAFIRSIAKQRGRNVEWAIMSVEKSDSITAEEALEKNVVEYIAADVGDLLKQINGKTVTVKNGETFVFNTDGAYVQNISMTTRQQFFNILANPNLAYILMVLGFYGLLYELTHPGFGVPGVLGTVFLILAYFSMQTLPTNFAGLALMFVGLSLFVAEVFVPGFGVPTLGGIVCLILGSLLLFDSSVPAMRVSLSIILSFSLTTAAITVFLVSLALRSKQRKVTTGNAGLIGEEGTAKIKFGPGRKGKVYLHGELWNAESDHEINKGDQIKVVGVDGLKVKVNKV